MLISKNNNFSSKIGFNMLKYIKVTNFYSIGETQEMSFEITSKDILDNSAREISLLDKAKSQFSLNMVSCIIGANGSGKTTMLKAISFLLELVQNAYDVKDSSIDLEVQHAINSESTTTIEIGFIDSGSNYQYTIEFNKKEIVQESLKKTVQRLSRVFEMTRKSGKVDIKTDIEINATDKRRFFEERSRVPVLSSLINAGYITDISFFKNFRTNIDYRDFFGFKDRVDLLETGETLYQNQSLLKKVEGFVKRIDPSTSDLKIKTIEHPQEKNVFYILQLQHSSKFGEFILDLFKESHGTKRIVSLLTEILPALESGGLVVLDEIENALHPDLTKKMVSLFESEKTNPKDAQLIFSTHQHPLIADRTKTQIFIAEKDDKKFETEVYRLDDIEGVRNDENYYHKYMAGSYGGVPDISFL